MTRSHDTSDRWIDPPIGWAPTGQIDRKSDTAAIKQGFGPPLRHFFDNPSNFVWVTQQGSTHPASKVNRATKRRRREEVRALKGYSKTPSNHVSAANTARITSPQNTVSNHVIRASIFLHFLISDRNLLICFSATQIFSFAFPKSDFKLVILFGDGEAACSSRQSAQHKLAHSRPARVANCPWQRGELPESQFQIA